MRFSSEGDELDTCCTRAGRARAALPLPVLGPHVLPFTPSAGTARCLELVVLTNKEEKFHYCAPERKINGEREC